jgi:hypothetical protein
LQKAALIAASVQLDAIAHLSLERAAALFLVAARAAGYPKELDGEALPSLVKRWLQSWRGVSGSADYSDWCGIACALTRSRQRKSINGCGRGVATQWRNCGAPWFAKLRWTNPPHTNV